jgi:anti-sigma regulatory factor (Ser/Thr protein kinase)
MDYTLENFDGLMHRTREGLRRIQQIVKDLRVFARLDESELNVVDLNEGIESTANIILGYAKKNRVQLVTELGPLPAVTCFAAKINQVVMNLLSNAIDACDEGGTVTIRTGAEPGGVRIEVADTGGGIPPEVRERIFDPFFTTKPIGVGTGLGLSISYGIVQDHGGKIEVESEPGQGSCFTVHLPLEPDPRRADHRAARPAPELLGQERRVTGGPTVDWPDTPTAAPWATAASPGRPSGPRPRRPCGRRWPCASRRATRSTRGAGGPRWTTAGCRGRRAVAIDLPGPGPDHRLPGRRHDDHGRGGPDPGRPADGPGRAPPAAAPGRPAPGRATLAGSTRRTPAAPAATAPGRPRDLIIGVGFVTADGHTVRGGGRVVKNVAGYDLPKLLTGSMGTLGILCQMTLKVRPTPEASALALVPFAGAGPWARPWSG